MNKGIPSFMTFISWLLIHIFLVSKIKLNQVSKCIEILYPQTSPRGFKTVLKKHSSMGCFEGFCSKHHTSSIVQSTYVKNKDIFQYFSCYSFENVFKTFEHLSQDFYKPHFDCNCHITIEMQDALNQTCQYVEGRWLRQSASHF